MKKYLEHRLNQRLKHKIKKNLKWNRMIILWTWDYEWIGCNQYIIACNSQNDRYFLRLKAIQMKYYKVYSIESVTVMQYTHFIFNYFHQLWFSKLECYVATNSLIIQCHKTEIETHWISWVQLIIWDKLCGVDFHAIRYFLIPITACKAFLRVKIHERLQVPLEEQSRPH